MIWSPKLFFGRKWRLGDRIFPALHTYSVQMVRLNKTNARLLYTDGIQLAYNFKQIHHVLETRARHAASAKHTKFFF